MKIKIKLNGEWRGAVVEPGDTLLEALREKFGVKSPKIGCARGDCGACTVLLNGKSVRSCLILAVETDGQEVLTVEGVSKEGPTPLQQAFIKHNAFQCGYCAPGIVMSATELLQHHAHPDEEQIREAISGNLCRCTGYEPVVNAIAETARGAQKKAERAGGKS